MPDEGRTSDPMGDTVIVVIDSGGQVTSIAKAE